MSRFGWPDLEPSSCSLQPTAGAQRRNQIQTSQLILLPPGLRAAWSQQKQADQLEQAALWDVWLRTGSDDAQAPQHWSGSVSDSNSSILHDLVSSQLYESVGSSVHFTSFSKAMVDSKPLAVSLVTELNKLWSLYQKSRQYGLYISVLWDSKANLSTKNVLLTWGSWQVLHMGQLFDCTAYNYINSELLPGSWYTNVHDYDLLFLIYQNTCHHRAMRSFIQ